MKSWLLMIFTIGLGAACYAQKGSGQLSATDIFADLPIADPAANSVLLPNEDVAGKIRRNVLVRGAFNRNRCYAGEPVLLTYQLHTALQSTSTVDHPPALAGFLATPMDTENSEPKYRKADGKQYRVFNILQWQLIPVKEGQLTVDSFLVDNKVKYKDHTGQTKYYTGTVSGGPVRLQVNPLPEKNKPADFSGMIGRFAMAVFPLADNLPAGANNTLQVEITGTGNFNAGQHALIVHWPAGIDSFEAKETLDIKEDSFPFTGRKVIELPFVPRKEGKIVIPAIRLSYFDPAAGVYKSITGQPVELNVLPAVAASLPKETTPSPTPVVESNPNQWYWLIAATALVLCGLTWWLIRRGRKKRDQQPLTMQQPIIPEKQEQPETDFSVELNKLKKIADARDFILAFKNLLTGYLQAGMGTAISLEEELVHKLRLKDGDLAEAVQELYYQCNTLLYSPGDLPEIARTAMLEKLAGIQQKGSALWS